MYFNPPALNPAKSGCIRLYPDFGQIPIEFDPPALNPAKSDYIRPNPVVSGYIQIWPDLVQEAKVDDVIREYPHGFPDSIGNSRRELFFLLFPTFFLLWKMYTQTGINKNYAGMWIAKLNVPNFVWSLT